MLVMIKTNEDKHFVHLFSVPVSIPYINISTYLDIEVLHKCTSTIIAALISLKSAEH